MRSNPARRVCVVSAPGRTHESPKVTDLLLAGRLDVVHQRFMTIIHDLGLVTSCIDYLNQQLDLVTKSDDTPERLAFGERLSAYIVAQHLGWRFVDATEVVFFRDGNVCAVATPWHPTEPVVVPGFYGIDTVTQRITLFPRGGSDITGAYLAAHLKANIYENWTDVNGVYSDDPRTNRSAVHLPQLSYNEIERLAAAGATVFHHNAILPVWQARIPVLVKNTFEPEAPGTLISLCQAA